MSDAQLHIMKMLGEGKITAEEAERLLDALGDAGDLFPGHTLPAPAQAKTQPESPSPAPGPIPADATPQPQPTPALAGEVLPTPEPPNFDRFRRFWAIPFAIALTVFTLFAWWLAVVVQAANGFTFGAFCLTGFVLLAAMVVGVAWWSRSARWVHVRVRPVNGPKISISIPFSFRLMRWGVHFGGRWVNNIDALEGMSVVDDFLQALDDNDDTLSRPLFIDVNDDDGDKVQVYIG